MITLHPQALRCFQAVLIVLCGIFSGYTLYELVRPYGLTSATLSTHQDALVMSETRADRPVLPPKAFSEIVERPLFMENRRPLAPEERSRPERPAQAEPDIATQISLSAIVIADDDRIAIIRSKQDRKLKKLRQGETFNGWTLTDVQTSHIAMQKGPDTRQIELTMKPSRRDSRELQ